MTVETRYFRGGSPKFGYEVLGTYKAPIEDLIRGSVFTCTETATADSITVGLFWVTKAWTGKVKCAIYKHSDLSLIGVTEERTIALTSTATWYIFNFNAPKPNVTKDTDYILVVWAQFISGQGSPSIPWDFDAADQGHYDLETYNSFPDPLVPTHESKKFSIYCSCTSRLLLTNMGTSVLWIDTTKLQWGIRVWKGTTELTAGSPVAVVSYSKDGEHSATWACPGSSASGEVIVRLYAKTPVESTWWLQDTFQTDDMSNNILESSTWTVVYDLMALYDEEGNLTGTTFGYNHTTYNSRIQNFSWSTPVVGIVSKRLLVGVGL